MEGSETVVLAFDWLWVWGWGQGEKRVGGADGGKGISRRVECEW